MLLSGMNLEAWLMTLSFVFDWFQKDWDHGVDIWKGHDTKSGGFGHGDIWDALWSKSDDSKSGGSGSGGSGYGGGSDGSKSGGSGSGGSKSGGSDYGDSGDSYSDEIARDDHDNNLWGTDYSDNIWAGGGDDWVEAKGGDDSAFGGFGDDYVDGGAGNDWIVGDEGHDTLLGGEGHDTLKGGDGYDTLIGGAGHDTLEGGALADTFVFEHGSGYDTIVDFNYGEGDRLDISALGVDPDNLWIGQSDAGAVIELGESAEVVLSGVEAWDVTSDYFL